MEEFCKPRDFYDGMVQKDWYPVRMLASFYACNNVICQRDSTGGGPDYSISIQSGLSSFMHYSNISKTRFNNVLFVGMIVANIYDVMECVCLAHRDLL